MAKGKIIGIGGIIFKSEASEELKAWYANLLGLKVNEYGALFESRKTSESQKRAFLQWSIMKKSSDYFEPSKSSFMINYRVDDLDILLSNLKSSGVSQIGKTESYEYGKFAWILDPDGNKIELWEPLDESFSKLYPSSENNHE